MSSHSMYVAPHRNGRHRGTEQVLKKGKHEHKSAHMTAAVT